MDSIGNHTQLLHYCIIGIIYSLERTDGDGRQECYNQFNKTLYHLAKQRGIDLSSYWKPTDESESEEQVGKTTSQH